MNRRDGQYRYAVKKSKKGTFYVTLKATLSALLALGTLALTGCASIVGDSNQTIAISSTPSQAQRRHIV